MERQRAPPSVGARTRSFGALSDEALRASVRQTDSTSGAFPRKTTVHRQVNELLGCPFGFEGAE